MRQPFFALPRQAGFTLVELMVTLAVIGLLSAVAILTLPGDEAALSRDAERLGARLLAARDHALFSGRETAAVVEARGYRFEERAPEGWLPLDERPLAGTAFDEAVRAEANTRIGFDAVGLADPAAVALLGGGERLYVRVSGAGEVAIDAAR